MKAAVLRSVPGDLGVEDIEIADPGPREVVVKTVAAGLCHSDLHFMEGKYPARLPSVVGHESAGVVERVGSLVRYVQPGDHVIACLSAFCGHCEFCTSGRPALCARKSQDLVRSADDEPRLSSKGQRVNQLFDLGALAEKFLAHEQALVKIRDDMPLDRAALLGCAVVTGLGAVFHTAGLAPGESAAVIGCGGIGLSAVQGARIAGANTIIAIDRVPWKLELARQLGATHTVDASQEDASGKVKEISGGGVHHAFEAVGLKATAEQAFAMLRNGGQATLVGMIPIGTAIELPGVDFLWEKRVAGSNMGSNRFRTDIPRYIDMYLSGRLDLDSLVTETISLERANDGYAAMKAGAAARTVVAFG